jgi:uncharacterized protein YbjT (DUF2867 family)
MIKTGGYPAMKVALTGATGFIGSHMLTELHDHGHDVTALGRDDARAARARAELGWRPSHPSLAGDFRHGSYRQ